MIKRKKKKETPVDRASRNEIGRDDAIIVCEKKKREKFRDSVLGQDLTIKEFDTYYSCRRILR